MSGSASLRLKLVGGGAVGGDSKVGGDRSVLGAGLSSPSGSRALSPTAYVTTWGKNLHLVYKTQKGGGAGGGTALEAFLCVTHQQGFVEPAIQNAKNPHYLSEGSR